MKVKVKVARSQHFMLNQTTGALGIAMHFFKKMQKGKT